MELFVLRKAHEAHYLFDFLFGGLLLAVELRTLDSVVLALNLNERVIVLIKTLETKLVLANLQNLFLFDVAVADAADGFLDFLRIYKIWLFFIIFDILQNDSPRIYYSLFGCRHYVFYSSGKIFEI